MTEEVKKFYINYSDQIISNKRNSPYPLRRYAHNANWETILKNIVAGETVLEVGCGEGVLSVAMAKKGAKVTSTDISEPNIVAARNYAHSNNINSVVFSLADAENLPFADNSFDVVVADNVLEHLPNFYKGLSEIKRVTKKRAIIALPTSLNLCAWCLLGGDVFWKFTRRTPYAMLVGGFRFLINIFGKGINEGYAGNKNLPHLWRYPWVMKKELEEAGFKVVDFEASTLCFPYLNFTIPFVQKIDKIKNRPFFNNFGYGSVAVVEKN